MSRVYPTTKKTSDNDMFACGACYVLYSNYNTLVEHLHWAHGTESARCAECGLRRWEFAPHKCHILPIDEATLSLQSSIDEASAVPAETYCFCSEVRSSPMIGCDGPECARQWFHFECIGILSAPEGNWYCPTCTKLYVLKDGKLYKH